MFEVQKSIQKPITVIRAASGNELSDYEKNKLAAIEDGAQKNKIEAIKLNDQRLPIDSESKEVQINLGELAFKSKVTAEDLADDELFFIKCELDDNIFKEELK